MGMTTATYLWRGLCALAVIIPTAANAQAWFAADCTIQNGERVAAFVSEGQARISYGEGRVFTGYPKVDGQIVSVVHIGQTANFVLSIDAVTGRGYAIMKTDRGTQTEYNASCRVDTGRR